MKELQNIQQDKLQVSVTAPVKKELKHIGSLVPSKGHTCYELNLGTGDVTIAVFDTSSADFQNPQAVKRKLITKEGCIYTTALNKKNACKKFKKMLFN